YCEIFLTAQAPYHPLKASGLHRIIAAHSRRAEIPGVANRGPHAFRDAFGTRLLNGGQSLKVIADMLGHRSLDLSFMYTKVDLETLKQLPLDWPEVQP